MGILNEQQLQHAKKVMEEYLSAPADEDGLTPSEESHKIDQDRIKVIKNQLDPLLAEYLEGHVPLPDFRLKIDSISNIGDLRALKVKCFLTWSLKSQMIWMNVIRK